MNLVNVGLSSLGAKIKTCSSCLSFQQQAVNILEPTQKSLWATSQGLPQFVIISLQSLRLKIKHINEIGFMLWHDYETNPKYIQLWVAQTTDQQFVYWASFLLEQKKGIQFFTIKPLISQFVYLKVSITQTYGGFQTYLNQIFIMADVSNFDTKYTPKLNKQLDLKDLQSNLQNLIEFDRKISEKKQKIHNKRTKKQYLEQSSSFGRLNSKFKQSESKRSSSKGFSIYYHEKDKQQLDYLQQSNSKNDYQQSLSKRNKNQQSSAFQSDKVQERINQDYYVSNKKITNKINKMMYQKKQLQNQQLYQQNLQSSIKNQDSLNKNDIFSSSGDQIPKLIFKNKISRQKYPQQQVSQPKYKQKQQLQNQRNTQNKNQQNIFTYMNDYFDKIQNNIQSISRKINVLDLKVSHTSQTLQRQIVNNIQQKIDQLIEVKLNRLLSSHDLTKNNQINKINKINKINNKQQLKQLSQSEYRQKIPKNIQKKNFSYKKNLTKQFYQTDQNQRSRDKTRTKRRPYQNTYQNIPKQVYSGELNRLKTSKSFVNIKSKSIDQSYVSQLLCKLNQKLKERQRKLKKINDKNRKTTSHQQIHQLKESTKLNRKNYEKNQRQTTSDQYNKL